MSKILVTGAKGLVGAEIKQFLCTKGHEVIATIRDGKNIDEGYIGVDLSMPNLDLSFFFHGIDGVIHTAAIVPNADSKLNDEENKLRNMNIDKNVYDFCMKQNIPVIYLSSCGLYDLQDTDIKDENYPLIEVSPYHTAKILGEKLFLKLEKSIIARISSPYGPNLILKNVLKKFLLTALNDETITIWGTGKREQDFIHVSDIARFVETALFSYKTGIYNVCHGSQISMMDLAKKCINICNAGSIKMNGLIDPAENSYPRFSIIKARDQLNWEPYVELETGLTDIVKRWKNEKRKN